MLEHRDRIPPRSSGVPRSASELGGSRRPFYELAFREPPLLLHAWNTRAVSRLFLEFRFPATNVLSIREGFPSFSLHRFVGAIMPRGLFSLRSAVWKFPRHECSFLSLRPTLRRSPCVRGCPQVHRGSRVRVRQRRIYDVPSYRRPASNGQR